MIRRPGESRIESAAACEGRLRGEGADWTKLARSVKIRAFLYVYSQMKRVNQHQLSDDNRCSLEVDRLPAIIIQIIYLQHGLVHQTRDLGEGPFEVCEERWIVESPF